MALITFDAAKVATGYDPVPAGDYEVIAESSEMKPTNANDGEYLLVVLVIISGPFANRKLFARFNLVNKSQKAVDFSQKMLAGLCRAVGVMKLEETGVLHNIPLIVRVKVDGDQNEITSYKALSANSAQSASTATSTAPVSAVAPPAQKPWQKAA